MREASTSASALEPLSAEAAVMWLAATEDGQLHDEIIARLPRDAALVLIQRVTYQPAKDKLVRRALSQL